MKEVHNCSGCMKTTNVGGFFHFHVILTNFHVDEVVAYLTGNQMASGSIPWRGKNFFEALLYAKY